MTDEYSRVRLLIQTSGSSCEAYTIHQNGCYMNFKFTIGTGRFVYKVLSLLKQLKYDPLMSRKHCLQTLCSADKF